MTRQDASARIFFNLLLVFLIFFLIFALLNTGLSFLYQPLFGVLMSAPTFTTLAFFALIMTLIIQQNCVATVPAHTVGLLTDSNGDLKTLVPSGQVWVWFGERLSGFISLEPTSTHASLLDLKSRDDDLLWLVMIITWRIDSEITTRLSKGKGSRQQMMLVAQEPQMKRERRVRDKVAEVLGRRTAQESMDNLEKYFSKIYENSFGQAVISEVNQYLMPIGLKVDRMECIGSIVPSTKDSATLKTISAARKKLEKLLQSTAVDGPLTGAQEQAKRLVVEARKAVLDMQEASRAVEGYVQTVIEALLQVQQHFPTKATIKEVGAAQAKQSESLTKLAGKVNALLEAANEVKQASEHAQPTSAELTSAEVATLFKVLEAIEQKKLPLGTLFP